MARAAHPDDDGALSQYVRPNEGLEFMRIVGEWLVCDDGVTRPSSRPTYKPPMAATTRTAFLIDTGRTVPSSVTCAR